MTGTGVTEFVATFFASVTTVLGAKAYTGVRRPGVRLQVPTDQTIPTIRLRQLCACYIGLYRSSHATRQVADADPQDTPSAFVTSVLVTEAHA